MIDISEKKLVQSKISSYFKGFKGIPVMESEKGKRSKSRRRIRSNSRSVHSNTQSQSTSILSSYSNNTCTTPKRKLVAQIFSEDEDSASENDQSNNNDNAIYKSPPKKPLTSISLNRPSSQIGSPEKSTISWTPYRVTSTFLTCSASTPKNSVLTTPSSVSNIDPCCSKMLKDDIKLCPSKSKALDLNIDPCCSKMLKDNNVMQNNQDSDSDSVDENLNIPKGIKILENKVLRSPSKINKTVNCYSTSKKESNLDLASTPRKSQNVDATSKPKKSPKTPKKSPKLNTSPTLNKTPKLNHSPKKENNVKDEDKKVNFMYLDVMKDFFTNVMDNDCLKCLLSDNFKELLKKFFSINRNFQYTCMKLFMWKPIWYNVFIYTEKIGLKLNDDEIVAMFECLEKNNFVDTDYLKEDIFILLDLLSIKHLREIQRSFKFSNTSNTREAIISKLLKNCKTQVTLTSTKSTEQVLRDRIKEKLGTCIKLSKELSKAFFNVYLLNTFTNPNIMRPKDYFKNLNIVFPTYRIEKYYIFYTEEEFLKYSSSIELRQALDDAIEKKNIADIFEICQLAFGMLQELNNEERNPYDTSRPKYLERFTAQAQYVSILSNGLKHVTRSSYTEIKLWLDYLISQKYCNYKRGEWYYQLSLIYTTYLKEYTTAAKLLISAFEKETEHLSEVQLHELANRGKMLFKKTYQLPRLYHDEIVRLSPSSCDRDWPQIIAESRTVRNNEPGRKRKYIQENANGDVSYLTVEQTALEHYRLSGFPDGRHCEGSLIRAAFCLLFFDVIYEIYVQGTFVSNLQSVPLDMYTKYFFLNRENSIRARLDDISTNWEEEDLNNFLASNWDRHSHENVLCTLDDIDESPECLLQVIACLGRTVLSKIFERLVKNYKVFHSGFPDLIVWNFEEKKAKFVEVKGENDTLSVKQKLWLNYLIDIGADVEVCHIHSRGSKKKVLKKKQNEGS